MRCLPAAAALAVILVGCNEPTTMPVQPYASRPELDLGTPPPPPISGDGDATLDLGLSAQSTMLGAAATSCSAATNFAFTDSYFMNDPANDQWVHINPLDAGRNVSIHQSQNKIDAVGSIVAPDFTFRITKTNGGRLIPGSFSVSVHGVLTFSTGASCETDGNLSGSFTVGKIEG